MKNSALILSILILIASGCSKEDEQEMEMTQGVTGSSDIDCSEIGYSWDGGAMRVILIDIEENGQDITVAKWLEITSSNQSDYIIIGICDVADVTEEIEDTTFSAGGQNTLMIGGSEYWTYEFCVDGNVIFTEFDMSSQLASGSFTVPVNGPGSNDGNISGTFTNITVGY